MSSRDIARDRFCQRCSQVQRLWNIDVPQPCHRCGGTNFAAQPPLHSGRGYELIDWVMPTRGIASDQDFLRVNGIDPQND